MWNQFISDFGPGILLMLGLYMVVMFVEWIRNRKPKNEPDEHSIFPGY